MKNKRNWNRKAAILAAAVLTSTCFFAGNIPAYADGITVDANVSGGSRNIASGQNSSVSGGTGNTASGYSSSVSGGSVNTASGFTSSVTGGSGNTASGLDSSVSGGEANTTSGRNSSVSGGGANTASGLDSSVSGGTVNKASGVESSVSGGRANTASGSCSSVSGGSHNITIGDSSSVSGGGSNHALGLHSSIQGGGANIAWGDASSIGGGLGNSTIGEYSYSAGGTRSRVQGKYSTGIGGGSTGTDAEYAVAIGHGAVAIGKNSIAIGVLSVASEDNVISFGHKAKDVDISLSVLTWPQRTDKDSSGNIIKNADGTTNDYTKAPTLTAPTTYGSDLYNRLVNVADGEDEHDVATVGQLNKKLDADASNVDLDAWAKKLGTGKIASGNTDLVTGGTVYTEVRPATDGNYVHTAFTTAANLKALDTQVKGNADHISTINTTLSGLGSSYSKIDLSNLNDNGKAKIRDLSKSAVKVVNGKNTKVRTGESGDATTYAVDVDTDAVTDTVKAGMKTELDTKANVDASNINAGVWATKLGTGTIASGNTGLVTGGTVYTEVRPTTDGNYIHTASTTAANLTALDKQVNKNANSISTINTTVDNLNDTVSKISTTGFSGDMKNQKITNLAAGTDAADAVNKGQMDKADADTLSLAKTYTNTAVNTAKNEAINASKNYTDTTVNTAKDEAINASKDYTNKTVKTAFDQSKNYTDEKVSNINNSIKNLQDSDGLNVKYTDSTKKSVDLNKATITNLGSGSIAENSSDAVNGGDVYQYVKNHANGGVEVDDNGNSVVNKNFIVNGDTTIKGDTNLQNTTVNKKLTVAGDTDLQNTTVNQKLTVNGDTNLQNTTVNKNLTVSGDTDLQNTTVNKNLTVNGYTTLGQTTINKQLAVQGNTYISQNLAVGGNATVAQNLVVGNTIAAKQVVADDAIIGGHSVIDEFNLQREDTDRVGAGAAALAALQYLPYEDGSKLVGGAGYGHYRGKNAGAVGLRYYPNRDVAFSMASTVGNGDTMLNAGVSFRIGSGTGSVHSIPDTNKVLKETQALNKALAERLDKVEKELKQSNDTNEELMKRLAALEAKMK